MCGIAYLSNLSQLFYTLTLYTSSSQSHGALWNAFLQWLTTKAINERARYIFLGLFWTDQKILMSYLVSTLIYVITLIFTSLISNNWKNKISINGLFCLSSLWNYKTHDYKWYNWVFNWIFQFHVQNIFIAVFLLFSDLQCHICFCFVKVSKSQKQISKFSLEPKNELFCFVFLP